MKQTLFKRVTAIVCVCIMMLTAFPTTFRAKDVHDMDNYWRSMLGNSSREGAYDKLVKAIEDYPTTRSDVTNISEFSLKMSDAQIIITAIYLDHPEYFWFVGSLSSWTTGGGSTEIDNGIITNVSLRYYDFGNFNTAKNTFETKLNEILNKVNIYDSKYEKELFIHDYLADKVVYDSSSAYNQNSYSAIVNKKSVCAGYAQTFNLLMRKLDIDCVTVIGTADNGTSSVENHAWNKVRLDDGKWYAVDSTWDRITYNTGEYEVGHTYFNITDTVMNKDHMIGESTYVPRSSFETDEDYQRNCAIIDLTVNVRKEMFGRSNIVCTGTKYAYDEHSEDVEKFEYIQTKDLATDTASIYNVAKLLSKSKVDGVYGIANDNYEAVYNWLGSGDDISGIVLASMGWYMCGFDYFMSLYDLEEGMSTVFRGDNTWEFVFEGDYKYIPGDMNADGKLDKKDAFRLIDSFSIDYNDPYYCVMDEDDSPRENYIGLIYNRDTDGNGTVNTDDATNILYNIAFPEDPDFALASY